MKFPILFVQTGFIVVIAYEVELNRINAVWLNLPNHNTQLSVCPPTLQRFLLRCFGKLIPP